MGADILMSDAETLLTIPHEKDTGVAYDVVVYDYHRVVVFVNTDELAVGDIANREEFYKTLLGCNIPVDIFEQIVAEVATYYKENQPNDEN